MPEPTAHFLSFFLILAFTISDDITQLSAQQLLVVFLYRSKRVWIPKAFNDARKAPKSVEKEKKNERGKICMLKIIKRKNVEKDEEKGGNILHIFFFFI